MIRSFGSIWLLPALALLVHPAAAYAAPGDPAPGSPSGAVYELPLEAGRADAAPRGGGGDRAEAEEGSFYRSENNFGSSAEVPGAAAGEEAGGRDAGGPEGTAGDAGPGTEGGDSGASRGGTDESGGAGGDGDTVADTGNTSAAAALGLLGAIGLAAAGVAFAVRRGRLSSG